MDLAGLATAYPWLVVLSTGLFGLMVGSFLNVVIHRLPIMLERQWKQQCQDLLATGGDAADAAPLNLVVPRSRCPHCGHGITAMENIPVVSFVFLRGRCAQCKAPISPRYPAIELLTALLSAAVAWHFGANAMTLAALVLLWALIAATFIDIDHQLLPDNITLPLLWTGLLVNQHGLFANLSSAVIGAVAGYLSLWSIFHIFKWLTGKEGMGYGDFKLFAAAGAWLGWQMLPLIILLASFAGAVIGLAFIALKGRDRRLPIPFGPFLCVGIVVALIWGDALVTAYLQFARITV